MNGEIKYESLRTTVIFHLLDRFTHKSTESALCLGMEWRTSPISWAMKPHSPDDTRVPLQVNATLLLDPLHPPVQHRRQQLPSVFPFHSPKEHK